MDSPSSKEIRDDVITPHQWTDEELEEFYKDFPVRWVVPQHVLDQAYDWSQVQQPPLMVLPAIQEQWRDAAHYKAYVRPTLIEEEE